MIHLKSPGAKRWFVVLAILAALASGLFAKRSVDSLLWLTRPAREKTAVDTSGIRLWMTLRFIADEYHVSYEALRQRLELDPDSGSDATLRMMADRTGQRPRRYLQRVEQAVSELAPHVAPRRDGEIPDNGKVKDQVLGAVMVSGYPALGLSLLLGSFGVPLPTGLAVAVAGSLAAQGRMDWGVTGVFLVGVHVVGDVAAYGAARLLSQEFLERRGRWLGYTEARRLQVERLFERWGAPALLLSRTLVSGLSAVVNLVAGATAYPLPWFAALSLVGRIVWTSAYFGLGYGLGIGVGGDLEAAAAFLANLTGFLVSAALLIASSALVFRRSYGRAGATEA